MLVIKPAVVEFRGEAWLRVASVSVSRFADRLVVEHGEQGPHVVFVDVPEQRVEVSVVQELAGDDLGGPDVSERGTFRFETTPSGGDAGARRVSMTAMVVGVSVELSTRGGHRRRVRLIAETDDGADDPVSVVDA